MAHEKITAEDGYEIDGTFVRAAGDVRGLVVFVHGLGGDRNEVEGLFEKAAEAFASHGLSSYRFDFRGNGDSPWPHDRMTVAGETLDLTAVVERVADEGGAVTLVAASFGALSSAAVTDRLRRAPIANLVLWNPVVDVRRTFVDPGTKWSRQYINEASLQEIDSGGATISFAGLDLGRELLHEITDKATSERLREHFVALDVPVLAYHGTADDKVPFEYTERVAAENPHFELRPLEGATHGFADRHQEVIDATGAWILSHERDSERGT